MVIPKVDINKSCCFCDKPLFDEKLSITDPYLVFTGFRTRDIIQGSISDIRLTHGKCHEYLNEVNRRNFIEFDKAIEGKPHSKKIIPNKEFTFDGY